MLFNVEQDHGSRIVAYVVPDGAGGTPSITIRTNGEDLATLEANETRRNLVEAGRHATGQCGFRIDETILPAMAGYADLEIVETTTRVLVYRRRPTTAKNHSVFRFESQLLPLWRLDDAVRHHFQFWYRGIERYGLETATQTFCMNNASSIYVSGRLLYKNFEYYLARGIKTVGLVRDPYLELAERLIVLKNVGSRAGEILGERDAMTYVHLMDALGDYETFDEAFCKRFFRRAPAELVAHLANPLVRQLTTATPDEVPTGTSVATALEALAAFDVLGRRADMRGFAHAFAETLELEPSLIPVIEEFPRTLQLGERLRVNHDVESILEKDLEVFHVITRAFDSVDA